MESKWVGGWVGAWVGGLLGRGDRGGSNEVLYVSYGWVGGWVGARVGKETRTSGSTCSELTSGITARSARRQIVL